RSRPPPASLRLAGRGWPQAGRGVGSWKVPTLFQPLIAAMNIPPHPPFGHPLPLGSGEGRGEGHPPRYLGGYGGENHCFLATSVSRCHHQTILPSSSPSRNKSRARRGPLAMSSTTFF